MRIEYHNVGRAGRYIGDVRDKSAPTDARVIALRIYGVGMMGEVVTVGVPDPTGVGEPVDVPVGDGTAVLVGVGETKIAVKYAAWGIEHVA